MFLRFCDFARARFSDVFTFFFGGGGGKRKEGIENFAENVLIKKFSVVFLFFLPFRFSIRFPKIPRNFVRSFFLCFFPFVPVLPFGTFLRTSFLTWKIFLLATGL